MLVVAYWFSRLFISLFLSLSLSLSYTVWFQRNMILWLLLGLFMLYWFYSWRQVSRLPTPRYYLPLIGHIEVRQYRVNMMDGWID